MAKAYDSGVHLAQVIAGGEVGGAERLFCQMSMALAKKGIKQVLITRPYPNRLAELKHPNLLIETARFGSPFLDFLSRLKVRRVLRRAKPKFVMSWMERGAIFVPHSDQYTHIGRADGYYKPKYYKSIDKLVAVSPPIAEHMIKQEPKLGPITSCIPNFIPIADAKKYKPSKEPTILALGRIHPNKGFDVLIRAVAKLPSNVRLIICGQGKPKHEAQIKPLPARLGIASRVKFLKWQQEPSSLIKKATIIAVPSRYEPFGLVFGEAWAHKKPLVATKCAGPSTHVEHRKTGMLCEIEDVAGLANALQELLQNPKQARTIALNGYKQWQKTLHPKVVFKQYLQLLDLA